MHRLIGFPRQATGSALAQAVVAQFAKNETHPDYEPMTHIRCVAELDLALLTVSVKNEKWAYLLSAIDFQ